MNEQLQLLAHEDLVSTERERMSGFIAEELMGVDISGDSAENIQHLIDVMTISAESLAQTIALARGDIDPNSDSFLSESIGERINHNDAAGVFVFDIDHELRDFADVDQTVVEILSARSYELAQVVVHEATHKEALKG